MNKYSAEIDRAIAKTWREIGTGDLHPAVAHALLLMNLRAEIAELQEIDPAILARTYVEAMSA